MDSCAAILTSGKGILTRFWGGLFESETDCNIIPKVSNTPIFTPWCSGLVSTATECGKSKKKIWCFLHISSLVCSFARLEHAPPRRGGHVLVALKKRFLYFL